MRLSGGKPALFARPWSERQRVVLLTLVGVNVAFFGAQLVLDTFQAGFVRDYLALSREAVLTAYSWEFITAMFLHTGPWHLLGSVLVLYFLGRDIEAILGPRHFLYLFLIGGIAGEVGHLFLMPASSILYAGSGGVAAVLVAYATILPELELFALPIMSFRLKAKQLAGGLLVLALLMLWIDRTGALNHSAWIGGCTAGWLYPRFLGFGRPLFLQRRLQQRRARNERYRQMTSAEFIQQEIDPLLEKISRSGIDSLTRAERRILSQAREKVR
jgi:rhomboid family protein